jgi:hypothetical protein
MSCQGTSVSEHRAPHCRASVEERRLSVKSVIDPSAVACRGDSKSGEVTRVN